MKSNQLDSIEDGLH